MIDRKYLRSIAYGFQTQCCGIAEVEQVTTRSVDNVFLNQRNIRRQRLVQAPCEARRLFTLMAYVIRIPQEDIRRRVGSILLELSDKERDQTALCAVIDVTLNLWTLFTILTLTLPVKQRGIDRIILIHGRWREIFLRSRDRLFRVASHSVLCYNEV